MEPINYYLTHFSSCEPLDNPLLWYGALTECNDGFLISEPCLFLNGILQVVPETEELSTTLQQHVSGNLNSVLRKI